MKTDRFKIVGIYGDKKITLKTVNDRSEAMIEVRKYRQAFTSSWRIEIEKSEEIHV